MSHQSTMTLAQLMKRHEKQGVAAMQRARNAFTADCIKANEDTQTFHREVVELLAGYVDQGVW